MSDKSWKDRNILITGCTGLLGSWLTKSLVEKGSNIVGLVRDSVPKSDLIRSKTIGQINTVRGEVEDYFLLERIINEYEIDTVFHLAAQTIVTIANRNPISTFKSNIEGTWNILEACRKAPLIKGIIVASSDKAYGDQKKLPYDEEAPLIGRHPYDVSKSCADLLCRSYFETYSLPVSVTRCGNLYGGGDLNFNRIVPGTIRSILNDVRPVIRSDGTFCRDYFYVKDAAGAYIMLAERMGKKGIDGEAFNFSPEHPLTVLELVNKILKVMGSNLKPEIQNEASNEIRDQYLSAKKARSILDWNPQYTLEEGLNETAIWYSEFFRNEGRPWEK